MLNKLKPAVQKELILWKTDDQIASKVGIPCALKAIKNRIAPIDSIISVNNTTDFKKMQYENILSRASKNN